MTTYPFIIAITLLSINASNLIWELNKETKIWRQNDIELATNAEFWTSKINKILKLNQSLTSIEAICKTAPTPNTLAALKANAQSIEFAQELMWRMIQAKMIYEKYKGETMISNTKRTNPGLCTNGHFSFDSNPLYRSYRKYSGIEILLNESSVLWKFRHPEVMRRL